jgi:hypothetical protein
MKQILTFIAGILMIAGLHAQEVTKAETLKVFLNGVITFKADEINQHEPLSSIRELAASNAAKTILLSKENIVSALDELANYSDAVIIVGGHTIAMITDAGNCQQSGAWGACMPKAKGFVQKQGKLIAHENYINFIIGVPDSQERTMFLFE